MRPGPNTSATGGYLKPATTVELPSELTFTQFIQTFLAGISGLPGEMVRPDWQPDPPERPDIATDWLAFGVAESDPTFSSYLATTTDAGNPFISQRQESFVIKVSIYGPAALENYRILRDGFQIQQNLEALTTASMGLIEVGKAIRNPELIGERWFNRWETFIAMRFESQRTYPVLTLLSASGTLWAPAAVDDNFSVPWLVTG
jgi:hypothetical protein